MSRKQTDRKTCMQSSCAHISLQTQPINRENPRLRHNCCCGVTVESLCQRRNTCFSCNQNASSLKTPPHLNHFFCCPTCSGEGCDGLRVSCRLTAVHPSGRTAVRSRCRVLAQRSFYCGRPKCVYKYVAMVLTDDIWNACLGPGVECSQSDMYSLCTVTELGRTSLCCILHLSCHGSAATLSRCSQALRFHAASGHSASLSLPIHTPQGLSLETTASVK